MEVCLLAWKPGEGRHGGLKRLVPELRGLHCHPSQPMPCACWASEQRGADPAESECCPASRLTTCRASGAWLWTL